MSDDVYEATARDCERTAEALDLAAAHLRTTARHFRDREVPRACAHAWAAFGHVAAAEEDLRALAVRHAGHARVE